MDTQTAGRAWNVSQRTVQDYCKNGYIPGVVQNSQKQYIIPDDAKKPYIPTKYVHRTASDDLWDLLSAQYTDALVSAKLLGITRQRYTDAFAVLREAGLIALRNVSDDPEELQNYRLTFKGIALMENKDPRKAFFLFLQNIVTKGTV